MDPWPSHLTAQLSGSRWLVTDNLATDLACKHPSHLSLRPAPGPVTLMRHKFYAWGPDGLSGWTERETHRGFRLSARLLTQDTSVCNLWLSLFKTPIRLQVGSLGLSYGEPFQSLF
jgi:hypothetical protein